MYEQRKVTETFLKHRVICFYMKHLCWALSCQGQQLTSGQSRCAYTRQISEAFAVAYLFYKR